MSAEGLNPEFLAAVRAHRPAARVRAQAEAAGMDLDVLRDTDPLTYAIAGGPDAAANFSASYGSTCGSSQ